VGKTINKDRIRSVDSRPNLLIETLLEKAKRIE
jgi:hypothetical protein